MVQYSFAASKEKETVKTKSLCALIFPCINTIAITSAVHVCKEILLQNIVDYLSLHYFEDKVIQKD